MLTPGQSQTTTFRFLVKDTDGTLEPTVVHTPMLNPVKVTTVPAACG